MPRRFQYHSSLLVMAMQRHLSDENSSFFPNILSQHLAPPSDPSSSSQVKLPSDDHYRQTQPPPAWFNSAVIRRPGGIGGQGANFLSSHNSSDSSSIGASQASSQWLSRSILHRNLSDVRSDVLASSDSMIPAAISHDSTELNNDNDEMDGKAVNRSKSGALTECEVAGGGEGNSGVDVYWQSARFKADILIHPLYEQLLSAHVACLRIATPVDQLPRIDPQLSQSHQVISKYSELGHGHLADDKELDQFMTHYVLLLCSFKEQLQQHVRVHAMEAVMACWEIEQSLQSLTGISLGEGTGSTMSEEDEDPIGSDENLFDGSLDGHDSLGFGSLVPTDSERSLMERVRQELKHDLKQGYKEKIADIREEILRKRRAGKLPGDTTSVLKSWWQSHSKWPYPTEEDKAKLVQETGLQLKQINNWFINQRKRNWNTNPSSSSSSKSKRKH